LVSGQSVRAFVAVLLPDDVRGRLAAAADGLRGRTREVAWVRPDNLHLTLRFLGEVDPMTLEHAREAMMVAATATAPFTATLGALGGFPSGRPPRVVWAGVTEGSEGLRALHAALESALVVRGIPGEGRAFHPHVTLGRARSPRGASGLTGALGEGFRFGEFRVATLHLMGSQLSPEGSRYSVLAEAPLGDRRGRPEA
jgi:2'-5' RNA ligase